ncbi:MAG: hypothetical protein K0R58_3797 [Ramlibacter sp.]|jgi:hypothetical protein|nr:hypothetical protein [Ramlibacter sp.]
MKTSRILHRDGRKLPLEQLAGEVSASLFQTDLHYGLCAEVARLQAPRPDAFPVLHNLLSLKSRILMGVTALLGGAAATRGPVHRVVLPPVVLRVAGERLRAMGMEVEALPHDVALVPPKVALAFFLKAVLHRAYRLAARPLVPGVPLVRAWVDVTEGMYGDLFPHAQIRVYPFSYGIRRQLAFVRSLGRRGFRWSFDGVPYRWRDAFGALAAGSRRHLHLAQAEGLAYRRFADELLAAGVREIHSSDEYEVGVVAAGERLAEGGASYVNTAHGIGLYCPQLAYARFDYLNDYQADFYRRMGTRMELRKRATANAKLPFERPELQGAAELALVYVHQNFEDYHLPSETAAQAALMRKLAEGGRELGVAAIVKLHPNMPRARLQADLPPGLRVASRWDELRGLRPVFLTIYSTAYYELAPVAPVLVYAAPTYNPAVYLDGDFETFTMDNLVEQVARLRDPGAWAALVDRQARSLQGAAA